MAHSLSANQTLRKYRITSRDRKSIIRKSLSETNSWDFWKRTVLNMMKGICDEALSPAFAGLIFIIRHVPGVAALKRSTPGYMPPPDFAGWRIEKGRRINRLPLHLGFLSAGARAINCQLTLATAPPV